MTFAHRTPSSPAPPPPPETTSLTPDTTPPPNANDDLARQARQILTTNCYRCHGQAGAAEGGFNYILDPDKLAAHKIVKPGDAEHSYLIRRVEGGEMPPEGEAPRPAPADIAVLRRWIDAGAPAVSEAAHVPDFLDNPNIAALIERDLRALPERDRRFARYFTLAHLANAGASADELQTYRLGLSKLLNSLSWNKEVVNPQPVDADRLVLRIDYRDYSWTARAWGELLDAYPHGFLPDTAAARDAAALTGERLPWLRADWFLAAASRPPLYHDLLQLPASEPDLAAQLHVDLAEDIRQERVARAGFNGSGVSHNNRIIERHASPYGAYWRSYDFAGNNGRRNLFAHPLGPGGGDASFVPDGGEIIFSLPDGLLAFMLVNGDGKRLDKASLEIVSDPRRPDRAVENGVSCMSCHARGLIPKADQVRPQVSRNAAAFSRTEADMVAALYPPEAQFTALVAKDNEGFKAAVEKTGGKLTATESVATLVQQYEKELDLKAAAAELGLKPEVLSRRLKASPDLGRELGPLRVPGGTVQRQVFNAAFADLVRELDLGRMVTPQRGQP